MRRCRQFGGAAKPWRLPLTSLTLAPVGADGSNVTHRFKFQFAPGFDGVREVLHAEGLFDTNIAPGMTLPTDLPALISLRMKARIEAEFPEETNVEPIGERGVDIRGDWRLHVILQRDGFAKERPITVSAGLERVDFTVENRGGPAHDAPLSLAGLPAGEYRVLADEREISRVRGGPEERTVKLPIGSRPSLSVQIQKFQSYRVGSSALCVKVKMLRDKLRLPG